MKKIAILNYHMACGGTEKALLALLNAIDYSNYEVTLYLLYKEGPLFDEIPDKVIVKEIVFTNIKYKYYVSEINGLSKFQTLIRRIQRKLYKTRKKVDYESGSIFNAVLDQVQIPAIDYDIVCDFSGYGSFLSIVAAKLFKASKRCMWIHCDDFNWLKRVEYVLPFFDCFFCVSNAVKAKFDLQYPQYADKSERFYNLINTEEIMVKSEEFDVSDIMCGSNNLLTVGRLAPEKGYDIAIRVAALLKKRGLKFKWYFMGSGVKEEELKHMIIDNDLSDVIELMGSKSNPYPYIKNCDLYVQLSRFEGYGITLLEARVLSCVILASDIPSFREQIINGVNGYLIDWRDEEKVADEIERLLKDKEKRKNVQTNLKKEIVDFSNEIFKLYDLINYYGG